MRTEVRAAPLWGNAISDYVKFLRAADRSPDTVYLRGYQLRILSQAFRGRSPWTLTLDDLAGFMASFPGANSTQRSMRTAIVGFYRYGVDSGKISGGVNPAALLPGIPKTIGQPRPAPMDSVATAIANADDRTRLMIYLGVYGGLRRAEIAAVHTNDLVKIGSRYALRVVGKGRKTRIVPMTPKLAALILAAEPGWLFPSWHRGQINSDGKICAEHLRPARVGELTRAALPAGVTCHMLRHRFATNAYAGGGGDILAVSKLLGHASVATTQVYTEIPDDSLWHATLGGADLIA